LSVLKVHSKIIINYKAIKGLAMAIDIDRIDVKILQALIDDARTKIKDIAKLCKLSPTAVTKRINRLKRLGVIKGAVLFVDMSEIGGLYPCSIEIENIKKEQMEKVRGLLKERTALLIESTSTGKSDYILFFVTRNINDIDNLRSVLRKYCEPGKISISYWKTPCFLYENLKIEPTIGALTNEES
jgi:Lrp/AsnC family transcriptional regulator, leucine-responsive regulatory protein